MRTLAVFLLLLVAERAWAQDDPVACWDPADGDARDDLPRCRRETSEMVELYAIASLMGLGGGAIVVEVADSDRAIAPFLFTGVADLAVYLADDALDGFLPGVPAAIGTGLFFGATSAFASWSAFGGELFEPGQLALSLGSAAFLGAGMGFVASLLRPSAGDISFVRSGGVFGLLIGALYADVIDAGDYEDQARTLFTGFHAGVGLAMVLAPLLDMTRRQTYWLDAFGLAGGALFGLLGRALSPNETDVPAGLAIAGIVSGMGIGYVLGDERLVDPPHVTPQAMLQPGGVMLGASSTF